jgi:hypothetical protein
MLVGMNDLFDPQLTKTLRRDKLYLEQSQIPIITVSATYQEDLKRLHGLPHNEIDKDVVFSRAHYSMALGVASQIWKERVDPHKAWVVDPTNYVSKDKWFSIQLTEAVGKTLARQPLLKRLKDFVDKFGRNKLPILDSITPPLLYLTEKIQKPVLSFHIAAGNILAGQGKKVVQVITDPHVREEYTNHANNTKVWYCVFDEPTKLEFLEKSAKLGLKADPNRVVVTGPPIDPRIIAARHKKNPWRSGTLRLCITTGGLGTNKQEILDILKQLLPELRKKKPAYQILLYAGTHEDFAQAVTELAKENRVAIGDIADRKAKLRLIHHPQIVDANELLIKYGFPWAHGFITKPSGDMAYDAAASGSFILTLAEWGEWEERIRVIFEQKNIGRRLDVDAVVQQLQVLCSARGQAQSWVEQAMLNAYKLEPLFLNGAREIAKTVKRAQKEMQAEEVRTLIQKSPLSAGI